MATIFHNLLDYISLKLYGGTGNQELGKISFVYT